MIIRGENDPIFPEAGARAYLRDLPEAEIRILDRGHFGLEDRLPEIAALVARFVERLGTAGP
jgi:pimeloyl-ACP methyl ester carboxylesterase